MLSTLCFTKKLHPQLLCAHVCGVLSSGAITLLFDTGPFTGLDLDEARLAGLGLTSKVEFLLELPQAELAY